MALVQPLDLYELLVNRLAGDFTIFLFMALVVIAIASAKFKMPAIVAVSVISIFIVMLSGTELAGSEVSGILLLIIIGIAITLGFRLKRTAE